MPKCPILNTKMMDLRQIGLLLIQVMWYSDFFTGD
jgi:hypothetical protein